MLSEEPIRNETDLTLRVVCVCACLTLVTCCEFLIGPLRDGHSCDWLSVITLIFLSQPLYTIPIEVAPKGHQYRK